MTTQNCNNAKYLTLEEHSVEKWFICTVLHTYCMGEIMPSGGDNDNMIKGIPTRQIEISSSDSDWMARGKNKLNKNEKSAQTTRYKVDLTAIKSAFYYVIYCICCKTRTRMRIHRLWCSRWEVSSSIYIPPCVYLRTPTYSTTQHNKI